MPGSEGGEPGTGTGTGSAMQRFGDTLNLKLDLQLAERLGALVPPAQANQVLYRLDRPSGRRRRR